MIRAQNLISISILKKLLLRHPPMPIALLDTTSIVRLSMAEALITSHYCSVCSSHLTCCKNLILANYLGNIFILKHSLMSKIFKFDSWSSSIRRLFKELQSKISRNYSCWSLPIKGGIISNLGHVDNLNKISDLNIPKSSGNFWLTKKLVGIESTPKDQKQKYIKCWNDY